MLVGLLHPGAMGAAIGAQLVRAGHEVSWCRAGRSERSARRARDAGLSGVDSLTELLAGSDVVLSVCPPAAAEELAREVADAGFTGVFVDANAISPRRMLAIADHFATPATAAATGGSNATGAATATVVDGAIIGPPPGGGRTARLYLSGPRHAVDLVYGLFAGTLAEPVRIEGRLGLASALKIAFGSFQKASRALAAISHALADEYGVTEHLLAEARALGPNALIDRDHVPSVAARAWRWAPEMLEGAETFATLGLPDELAVGAAAALRRWDAAKDDENLGVEAALGQLRAATGPG